MSTPSVSAKAPKQTRYVVFVWITALLAIVLPSYLFISQLRQAIRQHQINQTYIPVEATVLSSEVGIQHGSKGSVYYTADISYRYEVDGKNYTSEKVTPIYSRHSQQWAQSTVKRFKRGQPCQAFRDPVDPTRAILVKGYTFSPYLFMLEMAFGVTVGSFMAMRMRCEIPRDPIPAKDGWFEIKPKIGERDRLRIAAICTATWYSLGSIVALHYFSVVPGPYTSTVTSYFIGFGAVGLLPFGLLVRYILINRNFNEARLLIDKPQSVLGQPSRFTISQCAPRQLELERVVVQLRCIEIKGEGKSQSRSTVYEITALELQHQKVLLGQTLNMAAEIIPPSDQRPSGKQEDQKSTWINWELNLQCKIRNAPDYTASYPITVEKADSQELAFSPQNPLASDAV